MSRLVVRGGPRLRGEVRVAGSTSAALPMLGATLLAPGASVLANLPRTSDVAFLRELLGSFGCRISDESGAPSAPLALRIETGAAQAAPIGYEAVRRLRSATLLLGPLLARFGEARVALPGASTAGERSNDDQLRGLEAMGARLRVEHGDVLARTSRRLQGTAMTLAWPTRNATLTLMLAATLARGRTQIDNAARDPEIEAVAQLLNKMGARVQGAGTSLVTVEGVAELEPFAHAVPADRFEAGTLLVAIALTRGDALVAGANPEHLEAVLGKLRSSGVEITVEGGGVRARGPAQLSQIDLKAGPYPAFPGEVMPAFLVVAARARGASVVGETRPEGRLAVASELSRMGAAIRVDEAALTATAIGPAKLGDARVRGHDAPAAAALLLAGLAADGDTTIEDAEILDTRYERLDDKLATLGANVRRLAGDAG